MKHYKSLLAAVALAVSATVMSGCDEDLAVPPLSVPQSNWKANTKIADFKAQYWSADNNYCTQVGQTADGEDIILSGIVVANDEGGNIYQNIMIQDETGALCIATLLDSNNGLKNLYAKYKVGEQVFVNATGLYAGKYAGLFQLGAAGDYNGTPETSKMTAADFMAHTSLNGLPEPSKVVTTVMTIAEINAMTSVEDQQKWQSQPVRVNGVSWIGGGTTTWGDQGSSTTGIDRYLIDAEGNRLLVRNSNKSDFCDQLLPEGHGDVKGVLSYYNGKWQFVFQLPTDCIDFGGESYAPVVTGDGTAENPFPASAVTAGAEGSGVWVTGYIVGWISGQVLESGANFNSSATVASNILLANDPNEKSVGNCVPVQLVSGSDVRTALNLQDNATNLGKQVTIKGDLVTYFGAAGVKNTTAYVWGDKGDDSGTPTTPETPAGSSLYSITFLESQGNWTIDNANVPEGLSYVWSQSSSYGMKASGYASGTTYAVESWLVSPTLDLTAAQAPVLTFDHVCNYFTSVEVAQEQATLWVKVDGGAWQQITIPNYSTNANWTFVSSGSIDLSAYVGKKIQLGFKYVSTADKAGTWEIKNLTITGSGSITAN